MCCRYVKSYFLFRLNKLVNSVVEQNIYMHILLILLILLLYMYNIIHYPMLRVTGVHSGICIGTGVS